MNVAKLDDELASNVDGRGSDASATRNFVPGWYLRAADDRHEETAISRMLPGRLPRYCWDGQGNGSTMAVLVKRGLVVHGEPRCTRFGRMIRVKLTNHGRPSPALACPGSRAGNRRLLAHSEAEQMKRSR